MSWDKVKLAEICSFKTGKLNSNAAVEDGIYPFFTCSPQTLRINTFAFDTEAVLLAGNNASGVFPLKYYDGKFNAYQRTYVIRSSDHQRLTNRFLYYALIPTLKYFQAISIGVATQYLTKSILDNFELPIPIVGTQTKIAFILSAYDDLIENNNRRIELLEESARLLYREWFVKLKFPGHENTRITDGVPEEWGKKYLKDIAKINSKSLKKGHHGLIEYVDIASVSPHSIDSSQILEFEKAPSRARRIVKQGDIIWSCVRPNRRSHAVVFDPPKNLIVSTGFAVITPKKIPTSYLYYSLTTDMFVGYLTNRAKGAAYPAVTAKDFKDAEIDLPPYQLLDAFDDIVSHHFEQSFILKKQNQKLKAARDLLLPKLMNGDIPV